MAWGAPGPLGISVSTEKDELELGLQVVAALAHVPLSAGLGLHVGPQKTD